MDQPAEPPAAVAPSPDWFAPAVELLPLPPPLPPAPVAAPLPHPPHGNPVRRFFGTALAVFCIFLVVRTVALEPFGVPTGSMAPKLFGIHREGDCPRCGYRVTVGEPPEDANTTLAFDRSRCPNCGAVADLSAAPRVPGDRLLVDKTAFLSRPPRRWEVAVFRCPTDCDRPYVKRVIGLPGDLIRISDGDAYAGGELLRKTLAQVRETRVPVLDLGYAPPDGWGPRWVVEPVAGAARLPASGPPRKETTAGDTVLRDGSLFLDGTSESVGLTYRHWNLDAAEEMPVGVGLAYNGVPRAGRGDSFASPTATAAHDFMVEFDLEVLSGPGAFAVRLSDGGDSVKADLPVGETGSPVVSHDGGVPPNTGPAFALAPGKTYRIEFAFVDRRASLAVDGVEVVPPLDLPADPPGSTRRKGMSRPVQLGCRGASVAVRGFRLYRDVHYEARANKGAGWQLAADEYFVVGDNADNSKDSRDWKRDDQPAPGVPARAFLGKPFLIHQPMRLARVPPLGGAVRTVDWDRLRLLR